MWAADRLGSAMAERGYFGVGSEDAYSHEIDIHVRALASVLPEVVQPYRQARAVLWLPAVVAARDVAVGGT